MRESETVRMVATCRNCGKTIAQTPAGDWIPDDQDDILGFCVKKVIGQPAMKHEPMPDGLDGAARPRLT